MIENGNAVDFRLLHAVGCQVTIGFFSGDLKIFIFPRLPLC